MIHLLQQLIEITCHKMKQTRQQIKTFRFKKIQLKLAEKHYFKTPHLTTSEVITHLRTAERVSLSLTSLSLFCTLASASYLASSTLSMAAWIFLQSSCRYTCLTHGCGDCTPEKLHHESSSSIVECNYLLNYCT